MLLRTTVVEHLELAVLVKRHFARTTDEHTHHAYILGRLHERGTGQSVRRDFNTDLHFARVVAESPSNSTPGLVVKSGKQFAGRPACNTVVRDRRVHGLSRRRPGHVELVVGTGRQTSAVHTDENAVVVRPGLGENADRPVGNGGRVVQHAGGNENRPVPRRPLAVPVHVLFAAGAAGPRDRPVVRLVRDAQRSEPGPPGRTDGRRGRMPVPAVRARPGRAAGRQPAGRAVRVTGRPGRVGPARRRRPDGRRHVRRRRPGRRGAPVRLGALPAGPVGRRAGRVVPRARLGVRGRAEAAGDGRRRGRPDARRLRGPAGRADRRAGPVDGGAAGRGRQRADRAVGRVHRGAARQGGRAAGVRGVRLAGPGGRGAGRRARRPARHVRHGRRPGRHAGRVRGRPGGRAVPVAEPGGRHVRGRVRRPAGPVVRVAAHPATGAAGRARPAVDRALAVPVDRATPARPRAARVPAVRRRARGAPRRGPRPAGTARRPADRARPRAHRRRVADRRGRVLAAHTGRDRRPAARPVAVARGVVAAAPVVRLAGVDHVVPGRGRVLAHGPGLRAARHPRRRAGHRGREPTGRAVRAAAVRRHRPVGRVGRAARARLAPAARRQQSRVPVARVPQPVGRPAAGRARRPVAPPVRRARRPRRPAVVHAGPPARRTVRAATAVASPAARRARVLPVRPVRRGARVPVRPSAARGRRTVHRRCRRPRGPRVLHPRDRRVPRGHAEPVARPGGRAARARPDRVLHVPVAPPRPAESHRPTRPVEPHRPRPVARLRAARRVRRSAVRVRRLRRRLRLVPVAGLARLGRRRCLRLWREKRHVDGRPETGELSGRTGTAEQVHGHLPGVDDRPG